MPRQFLEFAETAGKVGNTGKPLPLIARLLGFLLLAACANPHVSSLPSPNYPTDSPVKLHHTATGFQNVGLFEPSAGQPWQNLLFNVGSANKTLPANHVMHRSVAVQSLRTVANSSVSVTWIGHSTLLVGINGRWILTDPFFGQRASPVPFIGPKRAVSPGLKVADLPKLDAIIISHNHYDHLDYGSLVDLARHSPGATVLTVLGNDQLPRQAGFEDVRTLDWFDHVEIAGVKFTAVPAVHGSRRGLFDKNRALWSGWSIKGGGKSLYFAGDTGYGSFIRDVRRKLGPHDIALVPIGAYETPELESEFHVTPELAVKLATEIGATDTVPIHWGTIALTSESFTEQKSRYLAAATGRIKRPHILKIGESKRLR